MADHDVAPDALAAALYVVDERSQRVQGPFDPKGVDAYVQALNWHVLPDGLKEMTRPNLVQGPFYVRSWERLTASQKISARNLYGG